MSCGREFQPKLILRAVSATAGSIPMASNTGERVTLPDEQAAPALTQMPARSSAITCVSARTPGIDMHVVLGSLAAAFPNIRAAGAHNGTFWLQWRTAAAPGSPAGRLIRQRPIRYGDATARASSNGKTIASQASYNT